MLVKNVKIGRIKYIVGHINPVYSVSQNHHVSHCHIVILRVEGWPHGSPNLLCGSFPVCHEFNTHFAHIIMSRVHNGN